MEHSKKNQAEKVKEISGSNPLKCMKCGKCSASCPAFEKMDIKPHQFVSYIQAILLRNLLQVFLPIFLALKMQLFYMNLIMRA